MENAREAVLKVLEGSEEDQKDLIVNQHQLKSLKSNPTANTALNKKQIKKLRRRAMACGLIGKGSGGKSMEIWNLKCYGYGYGYVRSKVG